MVSVDVRDFKLQIDRLLDDVEGRGEQVAITRGGRVVARLAPAPPAGESTDEEIEHFWAEWNALAQEIGRSWPEGLSAADAVKQDRREL